MEKNIRTRKPPVSSNGVRLSMGRPITKHAGGRPSKIGDVDIEGLITDIALGVPISIACGAKGLHRDTYYSWLENNPEFSAKVAGKMCEQIKQSLGVIRSRPDNWQAHAWLLERVYRDHFQKDINVNIHVQQQLATLQAQARELVIESTKAKELEDAQKDGTLASA